MDQAEGDDGIPLPNLISWPPWKWLSMILNSVNAGFANSLSRMDGSEVGMVKKGICLQKKFRLPPLLLIMESHFENPPRMARAVAFRSVFREWPRKDSGAYWVRALINARSIMRGGFLCGNDAAGTFCIPAIIQGHGAIGRLRISRAALRIKHLGIF
jgi:hypothetical protein